jgi:hypothetical protein
MIHLKKYIRCKLMSRNTIQMHKMTIFQVLIQTKGIKIKVIVALIKMDLKTCIYINKNKCCFPKFHPI